MASSGQPLAAQSTRVSKVCSSHFDNSLTVVLSCFSFWSPSTDMEDSAFRSGSNLIVMIVRIKPQTRVETYLLCGKPLATSLSAVHSSSAARKETFVLLSRKLPQLTSWVLSEWKSRGVCWCTTVQLGWVLQFRPPCSHVGAGEEFHLRNTRLNSHQCEHLTFCTFPEKCPAALLKASELSEL